MEVLGRVRAAGDGGGALIGKRVCAIPAGAFGGYAEVAVAPVAMTFTMPDDMDTATAASVYMPFHVASLALYERAQISANDTVLVHAAAGGAGSAAVQLACARGARVIATAGGPDKVRFVTELGADVAIDYRDDDFVARVLEATDGRGVDVAFDSVGGTTTIETFRCMAFGGRHLLVGFASGIEAEDEGIVPRPVLFGNFSLVGVCHAYTENSLEFKRATGLNFPSHADGVRIHDDDSPDCRFDFLIFGPTGDRRRDGVSCDDGAQRGDRRLTIPNVDRRSIHLRTGFSRQIEAVRQDRGCCDTQARILAAG